MIQEKALGHGSAQVSFGQGEIPKYSALRRAIQGFADDLRRPLEELRAVLPQILLLPEEEQKADSSPFRYTARQRRAIDAAIEKFLTELAGPDRTNGAFVTGGLANDTPDGVIQQRELFSYAIGLDRAGDLTGRTPTLTAGRSDPAVEHMMEGAFARLSDNGKLRLESVRDDIHGILVSSVEAGLSPLETGRQLSKQFDHYSRYEFERLARTEAAFAAVAGSRDQLKEFGVQFVTWLISAGACQICVSYEGKLIPIDDEDNMPPAHPQCGCDISPAG